MVKDKMCGIFAYLNFLTPKTRQEILELLLNGKLFAFTISLWMDTHFYLSRLLSWVYVQLGTTTLTFFLENKEYRPFDGC